MKRDLLTGLFRDPAGIQNLSAVDWDLVNCQAREAGLTGQLWDWFVLNGQQDHVPDYVARHLLSGFVRARRQAEIVHWEVHQIVSALRKADLKVLLLKGSAYQVAGFEFARGRMFSDIDILVPKTDIQAAERSLMTAGWHTTHHNSYDQRYYREWMHEIPPLRHVQRRTVIDVHHAILPLTSRAHPDSASLLADAVDIEGFAGVQVLKPVDMVLHSACHLFHEGEFNRGLRDLIDLRGLLQAFGELPGFWQELVERAGYMQLERPLFYALRYVEKVLDVPVPAEVVRSLQSVPGAMTRGLMDKLFSHAFVPMHHSCEKAMAPLAHWLLYVRGHYLRMPLHQLVPHLAHKAFVKEPS